MSLQRKVGWGVGLLCVLILTPFVVLACIVARIFEPVIPKSEL